jgi:predicted transcriptional regulator
MINSKKKISICLSSYLIVRVNRIAENLGRSRSAIIEEATSRYIENGVTLRNEKDLGMLDDVTGSEEASPGRGGAFE